MFNEFDVVLIVSTNRLSEISMESLATILEVYNLELMK